MASPATTLVIPEAEEQVNARADFNMQISASDLAKSRTIRLESKLDQMKDLFQSEVNKLTSEQNAVNIKIGETAQEAVEKKTASMFGKVDDAYALLQKTCKKEVRVTVLAEKVEAKFIFFSTKKEDTYNEDIKYRDALRYEMEFSHSELGLNDLLTKRATLQDKIDIVNAKLAAVKNQYAELPKLRERISAEITNEVMSRSNLGLELGTAADDGLLQHMRPDFFEVLKEHTPALESVDKAEPKLLSMTEAKAQAVERQGRSKQQARATKKR